MRDPHLAPRLARALLNEYAGELKTAIAGDDGDDTEAQASLVLAQALVMDDPVMKLMTGKINPDTAVERIRDMASAAGEKPSVMLKLLRQQFEMQIGSISRQQVLDGQLPNDDTKGRGNFALGEVTGEMSQRQFAGMVETTSVPTRYGLGKMDGMAAWSDDGTELKLKPASEQLHTVKKGDTLASLAAEYAGDAAQWQKILEANKAVRQPDGTIVDRRNVAQDDALPVGAMLTVPGKSSPLDLLAPYVAAFDDEEDDEPAPLDPTLPRKRTRREFDKTARAKVTPKMLKKAAAKLRSPTSFANNPYIPAPGIGQDHEVRAPLGSDDTEPGIVKEDYEELYRKGEIARRAEQHRLKEQDALYGALSAKQYAHLRMLARCDEEDMEAVLAREGKPIEDVIPDKIRERYGPDRVDDKRARELVRQIEAYIATVPLTVTFGTNRLFSDPKVNEPTHGPDYRSEVTFSRAEKNLTQMIGRDLATLGKGKVGITGGNKTGWEERGQNYMRWRRDKDDREGRHDELIFDEQAVFGAANPMFDQVKGGSEGRYGANYYGDAHFLLKDSVRDRAAFVVRAQGNTAPRPPVQRKNIGMLIYDMLSEPANAGFLDALLQNQSGSSKVISSLLSWEVHLYGGLDLRKDVEAIYLPSDLDKDLAKRITTFAKDNGIACQPIGSKPDGLEVVSNMDPKQVELPPSN